jgi:hypothetical protein
MILFTISYNITGYEFDIDSCLCHRNGSHIFCPSFVNIHIIIKQLLASSCIDIMNQRVTIKVISCSVVYHFVTSVVHHFVLLDFCNSCALTDSSSEYYIVHLELDCGIIVNYEDFTKIDTPFGKLYNCINSWSKTRLL